MFSQSRGIIYSTPPRTENENEDEADTDADADAEPVEAEANWSGAVSADD